MIKKKFQYMVGISTIVGGVAAAIPVYFEYIDRPKTAVLSTSPDVIAYAKRFTKEGEYREALSVLNKAINQQPTQAERALINEQFGNAYKKMGKYDDALEHLDAADAYYKSFDGTDVRQHGIVLKSMGQVYYRSQEYDIACEKFKFAKKILERHKSMPEISQVKKSIMETPGCAS